MSKEEDLKKKIKQDLMYKDKELIIGLYLQMKFEKDIFEQQAEELRENLQQIYSHLGVEAFGNDIQEKAIKEIAELKAENAKLSGGNIFYDYVKELQIDNRQKEQQIKEKDEEIATQKILVDYGKEEIKKLHKRINEIIKRDRKCIEVKTKQVCEKIRKNAEYIAVLKNGEIVKYTISAYKLDKIEKGEK